jgi:hypothetical protein
MELSFGESGENVKELTFDIACGNWEFSIFQSCMGHESSRTRLYG